ncbi:hypothetical protein [Olsenella sp. HMSC062G07]|uniref:hypothetical protein n=1 Tax=Olsenella sp. HMSC062G07 TaxID=1739330 RepID=UPI0008A6132A|nr:hypothetical protein [Olsenella sp. HMSC062G07]OFK24218.1 hypothetical protein HMPREF2826_08105 [Olsenella sp. HMSC062G07]
MAVSDAQKRADAKYKRERTKTAVVRFYPAEEELWGWLSAQPNKQGYVKRLIREDMERHR